MDQLGWQTGVWDHPGSSLAEAANLSFDTIPHDRLMALVGQKVSDGRVLSPIASLLKQGVLDGLREWTPEEGSPQGGCISPLLSNIYLNPLDI
jgi:RNA-directed DNA polymerase